MSASFRATEDTVFTVKLVEYPFNTELWLSLFQFGQTDPLKQHTLVCPLIISVFPTSVFPGSSSRQPFTCFITSRSEIGLQKDSRWQNEFCHVVKKKLVSLVNQMKV